MKFPHAVLGKIKKHLTDKKERIQNQLLSLQEQDPYSDPDRLIDNAASDTDAKEESSHERMQALEKELRLNLEEINKALERIKSGSYGKCLLCKAMINTDRLAVKPTALYCVSCERKKEK